MRLNEFIEASRKYQKRSTRAVLIPLIFIAVGILIYLAFQKRFEAYLATIQLSSFTKDLIALSPAALMVIFGIGSMIPLVRRVEREFNLPCPHCQKPLAYFPQVVIASKHCPQCGKQVIEPKD